MFSRYRPNHLLHIVLLVFICVLPYIKTLNYSWHLDDLPNILYNNTLHIDDLHPTTLIKTFYAYPGEPGKFFRPVANLSFAFNWFFGQDRPYGYHLVNIIIHCLTAVVLYLCCLLLLLQGPISNKYGLKHLSSSALLAAALWATAPIHTQAVTYIVQRMAQLATLFSITAILFFLLARITTISRNRFLFAACFLCSALLALGSKENSILLFLSVPLIEFIFFSQKKVGCFVEKFNKLWLVTIFLIILAGVGFILSQFSTNYEHRNFTLFDRLLTEPRILLFYLSQIFCPATSRLSIEHDITLSTSLVTPWSTLPAIIFCTGLIIASFFRLRTNPLLSFAILFFFVNHLVESTIIPLELLYEHRNYLPSLFLFLPISVFIVTFISTGSAAKRQIWRKTIIAAICTSFLLFSGISTNKRNTFWSNEESLWRDALIKAPGSARPKLSLASSYINQNRHQEALQLLEGVEGLSVASKNRVLPVALQLKGTVAYKKGNPDQAVMYLQQAFSLRSDYTTAVYKLIALLIELKRYNEALAMVSKRDKEQTEPELLLIKAALLLRLDQPMESLNIYHSIRKFFPNSTGSYTGQGKAMSLMGYHRQADIILRWAIKNNEPDSVLLRIENSLHGGENKRAIRMLKQLLQSVPFNVLWNTIDASQTGAFQIPFDSILLKQALLDTAINLSDKSS